MSEEHDFWDAVGRIQSLDGRFNLQVYPFVKDALDYTIRRIGERRHITAGELLDGFCRYARERFGPLANEVMTEWGITSANEIGEVVYQLIDAGVFVKQESDRLEDFCIDYDLRGAFEEGYFD